MLRIIFGFAIAAAALAAQTSFEVASVKPARPDDRMAMVTGPTEEIMRFQSTPGRIDYRGVTLRMLIHRAYGLDAEQISGPGWIDSDRYDITATHPLDTKPEEVKLMLRELLVERFQLQTHTETKQLSAYVLTVAKGGPKLGAPEPLPEYLSEAESRAATMEQADKLMAARTARLQSGDFRTNREIHFRKSTMQEFLRKMSPNLDRPVLDRTNLDGIYWFHLEWRSGPPRAGSPTPGWRKPSNSNSA